jgi:glycosyltransferase involved in cell wall biosynthesis
LIVFISFKNTAKEASSIKAAILPYQLSTTYRQRLEAAVGFISLYLKVSELRRLPVGELFKKLRSPGIECLYLLLEDRNSMALLPVLKMMAAISGARKLLIVMPDFSVTSFTRVSTFLELIRFTLATIHGQYVLRRFQLGLNHLLKIPLETVTPMAINRVLYLRTNLWYGVKVGGSVGHVAGIVNGLNRQGFAVDYVASELLPLIDAQVSAYLVKPLTAYGWPPEINSYRFGHGFARQIQKMGIPKPGFIYQRLSIADYTGPKLARTFKVPLVVEYNGSEVWAANNWGNPLHYSSLAAKAEMVCLRRTHLISVISEVLREDLITRGIPADNIFYYPNCIDPRLFNPERFDESSRRTIRAKYGITTDATVVTFIGTFGDWHGVDILALTIRQLIERDDAWVIKHRVHFLMIGDGLKMTKVLEILADERYRPYYTLTGLVDQDQAPAYLATADILVAPHIPNPDGSRFFGSPTKLFEYMAMGKGIVASDLEQIGQILNRSIRTDSLPEQIPAENDPRMAVLCKPGDPDSLGAGIRFLAERADWRAHLGKNARTEVLAKYTWERHINALLERVKQVGK